MVMNCCSKQVSLAVLKPLLLLFYAFANHIKNPKAQNTHKQKPNMFRGKKSFHEYEVKDSLR